MNRMMKALGGLLLAATLVACGGGGGSAGTNPNQPPSTGTGGDGGTGTTDPGTTTPVAATMIYTLSKNSLNNSGSDSAVLTVTALDANNNPVKGVPLQVSVDTGVYTPAKATTGDDGQAGGAITIGGSKANRNITATIRLGGQTATATVAVTGGAISISPVPSTPAPGQQVVIDLKVTDSTGAGVANVPVTLSGTLGATGTVTTDSSGNASTTIGAAPGAGTYSINASGLGVQATRSVQVVVAGAGGVPAATSPINAADLAVNPTTVQPNAAGSTTNRAALRAKFLNNLNQPIANVRVLFVIDGAGLGNGEQISSGNAVVYSDVNGEAIADYIPGTRSSPTDGVTIRACYSTTDAGLAGCPTSVTETLTVTGQPLSITLGDNNLLERGNNSLTYIKKFDVAVVDSAGNVVPDAIVSASVDITEYAKGAFVGPRISCLNEDTNRNGFLDAGEDINGTGLLEPYKADIALSFLGSNKTGTNGRMAFQVEYPQNVASWLAYTIRVTTTVGGSEGTVTRSFVTDYLQADEPNGSFRTPPYGSGACTSPN